ncbi:MAG: aldose 1-epimerase family protein [Culicoidibacterales bacterium]
MIILENEFLHIEIAYLGAQLTKVYHKQEAIDYIWEANPKYWGRHAPILFPIVGRLAENRYYYQGKSYEMSQHGFARDQRFAIVETTENSVRLRLQANEETRAMYPFEFMLDVIYTLEATTLTIDWQVKNPEATPLHFAIGAHPGFSTKLLPQDQFTDYVVEFAQAEDLTMMKLDPNQGLFTGEVVEVAHSLEGLPLHHDLFDNDAMVFNHFTGGEMTLRSINHDHGLTYGFQGFPYVAIWSTPGAQADFVCLEPWYGHADTEAGPFELSEKPAIQTLEAQETFFAQQTLKFF